MLSVPALVPHGFRFKPGIDGSVFTVLQAQLTQVLAAAPALPPRLLQPRVIALHGDAATSIERAVGRLKAEFVGTPSLARAGHRRGPVRAAGGTGARHPRLEAQRALRGSRAAMHLERYRELVDASYRTQPSLSLLAQQLGITSTQLNRVCRQLTGRSALALLHARVLLEAQRDLAYTTLSIKQVALGLGFGDAGYFTRFFQRLSGRTPTQWRGQADAAPRLTERRLGCAGLVCLARRRCRSGWRGSRRAHVFLPHEAALRQPPVGQQVEHRAQAGRRGDLDRAAHACRPAPARRSCARRSPASGGRSRRPLTVTKITTTSCIVAGSAFSRMSFSRSRRSRSRRSCSSAFMIAAWPG